MPTVSVDVEELFERLERRYTQEEFENLCFAFGLELDDVVEEEGQTTFKIEVPANRYDLLCVEGLARALRAFVKPYPPRDIPLFKINPPTTTVTVSSSVNEVRPHIACAIVRGVRLNAKRLRAFVNFQEKLHHTLCRRRTVASIGAYDLRQICLPLSYEALPPEEFRFHPLGCADLPPMNGVEMISHFSSHLHLKQYLHMLEGQPLLPVFLDSERQVLSAPPLINADFCRLTEESRDVLIDVTSVHEKKAELVLLTVALWLSEYSETPFQIEAVEIGERSSVAGFLSKKVTPVLKERRLLVQMDYLRKITGVQTLTTAEVASSLKRLMLSAWPDPYDPEWSMIVKVPPMRSDVLHACDVAEDLVIGLGFSRLPVTLAPILKTNKRNVLAQSVRAYLASLGYNECLNFALCSAEENFAFLKRPVETSDPQNSEGLNPFEYQETAPPVLLANAKTRELTETRVQLISGLLKSLANNVGRREMPIRLFEVGDVVVIDKGAPEKTRNLLYGCAAFADEHGSGLEEVHGVLDALFERLGCIGDYALAERRQAAAAASGEAETAEGSDVKKMEKMRVFSLKEARQGTFLSKRHVDVICNVEPGSSSKSGSLKVGTLGTLDPDVLRAFGLSVPVSVVEFTLEPFVQWLSDVDIIFA